MVVSFPGAAVADDDDDATELEEIVVYTDEPVPSESASEDRLDRDIIDAAGVRSAQDLLGSMSGLQLSQHGSEGKAAQFFLRGFDAAHGTDVTIGVDGLVFNEPSHIHGHGYADIGVVIPEAILDVRLRKGAYALDQGNLSTAGDINYRLGVPEQMRGVAMGAEAGWPYRSRIWSYFADKQGDRRDVIAAEVVGDAGPFENRGTRRAGLIGQQTFGDWRIRGALQGAQFGLPGALPMDDLQQGRAQRGETYTPDTVGRTAQGWIGAVHEHDGDDRDHRSSLDLRVRQFDGNENFTGWLVDEDHGDERREFQRGISLVAAHQTDIALSPDWSAVVHLGAGADRFRQFEDGVDSDGRAHTRHRGGVGWQGQVHLAPGLEGFVTDWLDVEAGVRLEALGFAYTEDDAVGGERGRELLGVAAPRGRARMYAGENWTFVVAAGRGFRGPRARVFASDAEEVDFEMDARQARALRAAVTVVDGAEAGMVYRPHHRLELSATGFGHLSRAEFVYDHVSRLNVDLGATRRFGAELAANWMPAQWLRARGHVTAVDARFADGAGPIPFVPPVEAGAMVFGRGPEGTFGGVEWRAVSSRPLPFGARGSGWSLFNAHVGWESNGWELRLNLDNLLDADWNEGVYHFASDFDGDAAATLPSTHVVAGHPRMVRVQLSHRW